MTVKSGSSTINKGLVFYYDMDDKRSWKGKPTKNLFWYKNAARGNRKDYAKSVESETLSGNFDANHPGRIGVTLADGNTENSMINTGVTDWANTHHAHWQYDSELRKPVCVQNDVDGNWKSLGGTKYLWNFSSNTVGISLNDLGWSAGQQFSISWLNWTNNTSKTTDFGLYLRDDDGVTLSFYAGLAKDQATAFNTQPHTWQRVYATFTLPSGLDLTYWPRLYGYGHNSGGRGITKCADVQIEEGVPSLFVESNGVPVGERTSTESLFDIVGGNTITINSLTYSSNGAFSFNGTTNDLSVNPAAMPFNSSFTFECWVNVDTVQGSSVVEAENSVGGRTLNVHLPWSDNNIYFDAGAESANTTYDRITYATSVDERTGWHQWVFIKDIGNSAMKIYRDGTLVSNQTGYTKVPTQTTAMNIGSFVGGTSGHFSGQIPIFKLYDRALLDDEIKQNFNANRTRFGI